MLQAPAGHPSDVPARLLRLCDLADAGDSWGSLLQCTGRPSGELYTLCSLL